MATNKNPRKTSSKGKASTPSRTARKERQFPALTFEEALTLAEAIQKYAAGQKVRRLTLFEQLDKSPDSNESRRVITASNQYGLTKGSYAADYLELTPEGAEATSDETAPARKLEVRFSLAVINHASFEFLYSRFKGNKIPAREIMIDCLSEANVDDDEKAQCIDTFILNVKFLGLLRTIAGSERIVPIEQALEEAASVASARVSSTTNNGVVIPSAAAAALSDGNQPSGDFDKICFFVTPIGEENSEERKHSDFLMEYIIKPAVKEFNLSVVRADQIGKPGIIGKQVIEHVLRARLVIADLSFHNPNVFYELSLRHATRLPTVQVKRTIDKLPFDLNQYRTIPIETRDPYTLVAKIQTYTVEVANQVRRALEDSESGDNPISLYYPSAKLEWDEK